jgi:hypothetical protein
LKKWACSKISTATGFTGNDAVNAVASAGFIKGTDVEARARAVCYDDADADATIPASKVDLTAYAKTTDVQGQLSNYATQSSISGAITTAVNAAVSSAGYVNNATLSNTLASYYKKTDEIPWSSISDMPSGFSDGVDNVGITGSTGVSSITGTAPISVSNSTGDVAVSVSQSTIQNWAKAACYDDADPEGTIPQTKVASLTTDLAGKASAQHNHDSSYAAVNHQHSQYLSSTLSYQSVTLDTCSGSEESVSALTANFCALTRVEPSPDGPTTHARYCIIGRSGNSWTLRGRGYSCSSSGGTGTTHCTMTCF